MATAQASPGAPRIAQNFYEISHVQIGKGGFATVYKGSCRRTGSVVAVKMIDRSRLSAALMARVKNEISIHSQLNHPNVAQLLDYFQDKDFIYLMLQYCENGDLHSWLKKQPQRLSEDDAKRLLNEITSGLLYLHSQHICHRDLSPSNVLLTSDLHCRIADFGLAVQLADSQERHFTLCGTPNYISPEVANQSAHGLESDVWALGCITYVLLVGHAPFDTQSIQATLERVRDGDYTIPATLSASARDLITRLLQKDQRLRPSLQEVARHPFLTGKDLTPRGRRPLGNLTNASSSTLDSGHGSLNGSAVSANSRQTGASARRARHTSELARLPEDKENINNNNQSSGNHMKGPLRVPTDPPIEPLCALRLRPFRQKTGHAVVNILEDSSVMLEFYRTQPSGTSLIVEVLQVSADGARVQLYQPSRSEQIPLCDTPVKVEQLGEPREFTLSSLPPNYAKKYAYARRFVQMVRTKTPKITLYTNRGKCMYMESGTDFEVQFYNGAKLTMSESTCRIIQPNGGPVTLETRASVSHLADPTRELYFYSGRCQSHCKNLEKTLTQFDEPNMPTFPAIIGKRPAGAPLPSGLSPVTLNSYLPPHALSSLEQNTSRLEMVQQLNGSTASVSRPPSSHHHHPPQALPPRGSRTRSASVPRNIHNTKTSSDMGQAGIVKSIFVHGLGWASERTNGDIALQFNDGIQLILHKIGSTMSYILPSGSVRHFDIAGTLPTDVKTKVAQLPVALKLLSQE